MTHPRRIIRDSVTEALAQGQTLAGARVWAGREPPVNVDTVLVEQGPVILVYTRMDRTPSKDGASPTGEGWQKRECDLIVEVLAAGTVVVDNKLDDIAEQVETLLDDFAVPGQPSTEIRHVETSIESTSALDTPVGGAMILYEVCYWKPWRVPVEEEPFPCPTDVGVKVNGGPREKFDALCDCPGDGDCMC